MSDGSVSTLPLNGGAQSVIEYDLAQGAWVTPAGHPARFTYRLGTNDWNTISSTMAPHDEYHLPQGLTGVALDVGAYLGSVAVGLALDNPDLRVIAVEPVPENAHLSRQNIADNGCADRVTLIEGAAGDGSEVEVWYRYRGNETAEHHAFVGNSSLAYDHGGELEHETVYYRSFALNELVRDFGPFAWAKIDCEGGEFAFFDTPAVAEVFHIEGEWHSIRGHTRADLLALLAPTHDVTFAHDDDTTGGFTAVRR